LIFHFRIRLYSTKTLKPLGTLSYHKEGCQAVSFAHSLPADSAPKDSDEDSDDEEMTTTEKETRARWLVAAGKDNRVSIWEMISFHSSKR
ncbi:hypothetical protein HWV62_2260, partial [Athelia sp. TMB]